MEAIGYDQSRSGNVRSMPGGQAEYCCRSTQARHVLTLTVNQSAKARCQKSRGDAMNDASQFTRSATLPVGVARRRCGRLRPNSSPRAPRRNITSRQTVLQQRQWPACPLQVSPTGKGRRESFFLHLLRYGNGSHAPPYLRSHDNRAHALPCAWKWHPFRMTRSSDRMRQTL
jgi:hypothetical protein